MIEVGKARDRADTNNLVSLTFPSLLLYNSIILHSQYSTSHGTTLPGEEDLYSGSLLLIKSHIDPVDEPFYWL